MALPLILYDVAPLVNPSFETDADAVSPPTGWTTNRSGTGKAETDTAQFHSRGSNEGVKSVLMAKGDMGSDVHIQQDVAWVPPVGTKIGMHFTFRHSTAAVQQETTFHDPTVAAATGGNWRSETNVFASDDSRAIADDGAGGDRLAAAVMFRIGTFGFLDTEVPADAVITGIEVGVEGYGLDNDIPDRKLNVNLLSNVDTGAILATTTAIAVTMPKSIGNEAVITAGSPTNLWGAGSLNRADFFGATLFGIGLTEVNTGVGVKQLNVDHVKVRIFYTSNSEGLKGKIIELDGTSELDSSEVTVNIDTSGVWGSATVFHTLVQPTSVRDGLRLQFDVGTKEVPVDYIHVGRVVDFATQPFTTLDVTPQFRSVVNQGGSAFEAVELADPFTTVRANFDSIAVDSTLEADLMAFYGYSRQHRRFAFWLDRDDPTNEGKHFSECTLTRGLAERHGSGAARFGSRLEFVTPREWVAQEVA